MISQKKYLQFKIIHGIIVNVDGGLAQLGERLPYKQRVGGSSPSASTMNKRETDSNLINKAKPFFFIFAFKFFGCVVSGYGESKICRFLSMDELIQQSFS